MHYDLSNDLFAAFLDETMTACAQCSPTCWPSQPAWTAGLQPNARKIDRPLDVAGVQQAATFSRSAPDGRAAHLRGRTGAAHIRSVTSIGEQHGWLGSWVAAAGFGPLGRD